MAILDSFDWFFVSISGKPITNFTIINKFLQFLPLNACISYLASIIYSLNCIPANIASSNMPYGVLVPIIRFTMNFSKNTANLIFNGVFTSDSLAIFNAFVNPNLSFFSIKSASFLTITLPQASAKDLELLSRFDVRPKTRLLFSARYKSNDITSF